MSANVKTSLADNNPNEVDVDSKNINGNNVSSTENKDKKIQCKAFFYDNISC